MVQWLKDVTETFWRAAGEFERFPRNLEEAVLWALPLAVLKLPRLWIRDVEAWVTGRGIVFQLHVPNRALRGCLLAHTGHGFVLLDGTDPEDEQRFSLAHEVAHFLIDYLEPRRRAVSELGESILEVLDGVRPATHEERVSALLGNAAIGVHTHFMDRASDGSLGCQYLAVAEGRADRLALELLAPVREVRRRLDRSGRAATYAERIHETTALLTGTFGLPLTVADLYGRWLCRTWFGGESVREWLGI